MIGSVHNTIAPFLRENFHQQRLYAPTPSLSSTPPPVLSHPFSLMFESPLSERKTNPRRVRSSQYCGGVLSPDERRTPAPCILSAGCIAGVSRVPQGRMQGVSGGKGVARLLLLRGVTSRLISFHFLSFHPSASIPPEARVPLERKVHACVQVHMHTCPRLLGAVSRGTSGKTTSGPRGKTTPSRLRTS